MTKIIFVCTANLCRSAMAELIMRQRLQAAQNNDIQVSSMGVHAVEKQTPPPKVIEVCREQGLDCSVHLSRPLIPSELKEADFVFVMEPVHKHFFSMFFPALAERVVLLGGWPDHEGPKYAIRDPMGKDIKHFRKTFNELAGHIDRILPLLDNR
jgi:protein-tyrosine phosphatase